MAYNVRMLIDKINDNIQIEYTDHPLEHMDDTRARVHKIFPQDYIIIQNRKFPIINPGELVRSRNTSDGYYRVIYIQINMATGEYYIGKANRPTYNKLQKYAGSGLRFKNKFNKHKDEFVRYYIAVCKTAKETEELEASIVNESLLTDEKCLNLVCGGGGTTEHPSLEEKSKRQKQYMLEHPEQYKKMLAVSKQVFRSGNTSELRLRNDKIKKTMSDDSYKDMTRNRIQKWREEHPEEYAESRRKLKASLNRPDVQIKRKQNMDKWKETHPEEVKLWQENKLKALKRPEVKEKHKLSLKKWREEHPEEAKAYQKKRTKASIEARSKSVCMIDLQTGNVVKIFNSAAEAGRFLTQNDITHSVNPKARIGAVCLQKTIKGHGTRYQAYGYGWVFETDFSKGINRYKK